MTAIAAVVHDGRVHIGGDSAGVGGYDLTVRKDVKVFTHPQRAPGREEIAGFWAMGYTTSFRMGQVLQYAFVPPVLADGEDVHRFMCTTFVDELRTTFKDAGWARSDSGVEETGQFLVGVRDRLFIVDSDYQIGESADGYAAVGCGADLALGSLHTTRGMDLKPRRRLKLALAAAAHHSAGVIAPFIYARTAGGTP
ncbi:hypothetical protein [Nocardiopsis sp. NPDC057823]|uniref:hypothetical protein n=1 Tax=Nocardiopsis sp. NPDC057823 TaxID=3346256 RepID=UPI00366BD4A5